MPRSLLPKSLLMVAQRLAAILDQENAALRAMDLRRAAALLPEKTAAIADLAACGAASPETSDPAVVSAARTLDDLARENRCLLERAIAAQRRVIGIVVRAAAEAAVRPTYGAKGRPGRLTAPMALSTRA